MHDLKIQPEYFEAWMTGKKRCEIRSNDRDFKVGDTVRLWEWKNGKYTGRCIESEITHIDDIQDVLGLYDGGKAPRAIGLTKTKSEVQLVALSMSTRHIVRNANPPSA